MFFIYDCNRAIVGNSKGYKTFKGALTQQQTPGSPACNAVETAFKWRSDTANRTIATIEFKESK